MSDHPDHAIIGGQRIPIIHVDNAGADADGATYDMEASPEAIADGFVCMRPVLLCFPDGSMIPSEEVRLTPKGMSVIAAEFGTDRK